jgi:hypothetical protein
MKTIHSFIAKFLVISIIICIFTPTIHAYDKYGSKYSGLEKQIIKILYDGEGGKISCGFDSYQNTSGRHEGIDFALKNGASIYSVADGEIIRVSNSTSLSTLALYIDELDITVIYLHSNFTAKTGKITKGERIGYEDDRGAPGSPHTHIEIRQGKKTSASKSVGDYTLSNPLPFPYWEKILNMSVKPSKPSITSFEAKSTSSIEISWKSVSGATKYRIDRRKKGEENYKTLTSSCTSTSYTDKNLSAGSLYYYRVYAINSAGTSPRSETYATYTKPSTPKEPTISRDSQSQLTVSWSKVSGATHYKLLCRKAGESDYKVVANNLTGTSYVHKGLRAGTRYCYRVVAVAKVSLGEEGKKKTVSVESSQSDTKSKCTTAKRPSNTVDNNNPTHTILKWDKAVGDESSYTYEIWRNGKRIGTTKNTEYIDK